MVVSEDFPTLINRLIRVYVSATTDAPNNLRRLAAEKKVLPLMWDWGGILSVNAEGAIFSCLWDNWRELRVETDPRIRNIAFIQGSRNFPELKDFVPARPNDARTCSGCGGSGVEPYAAEMNTDSIVCYCGGVGWIP
jgi:hypothetical protein